jgi:hypothetical protein
MQVHCVNEELRLHEEQRWVVFAQHSKVSPLWHNSLKHVYVEEDQGFKIVDAGMSRNDSDVM